MEAVWRQRRAGTWEGAVKGSCQGWWQQRRWHVHTTGQQQRAVVVRATLRRGHSYMKILRDRGEPNRRDTLTQW